jgi:hypothetical protein
VIALCGLSILHFLSENSLRTNKVQIKKQQEVLMKNVNQRLKSFVYSTGLTLWTTGTNLLAGALIP